MRLSVRMTHEASIERSPRALFFDVDDSTSESIHRALNAIVIVRERFQGDSELATDRVVPVQRAKTIFQVAVPVLLTRMLLCFQV
jgi:hypothetical protein